MDDKKQEKSASRERCGFAMPLLAIPVAFFLVELFAFQFLKDDNTTFWPLAFGGVWAVLLTGLLRVFPRKNMCFQATVTTENVRKPGMR